MLSPLSSAPADAARAHLVSAGDPGTRIRDVVVYSAAMRRNIPLSVITPRPSSRPAGVFYLLNGAGGGEDRANWLNKTDVAEFFADKNVLVVIPSAGAFSYYTDWRRADPELGLNRWSTFLGRELPPIIDAGFHTSGRNVIGGISTSGTAVLNLAIEHRGLYRAVGAYSGCPTTSDPFGQSTVRLVVETRGGGDATNMWGPYDGAGWRAHDPVLHAEKLRGLALYISNAGGLPGAYDTPRHVPDPSTLADQIVVGGGIEMGTMACTVALLNRLGALRIPATVDLPPTGTHSWRYWQDQLHKSWPVYAKVLARP